MTAMGTNKFVYDGWLPVREQAATGGNATSNYYVWGLDLSQSMQGAGGIGGLLMATLDGKPYFSAFDANGNVTEYTDTNGTVVAHYAYDPFGNISAQSGAMAADFSYRFSTKYTDDETGLVYYGYRFYSPSLGRWLNRDPLGDYGFFAQYTQGMSKRERRVLNDESRRHPYAFVYNDPVAQFDALGLVSFDDTDCANADPTSDTAVCDVHKGVVLEKAGVKWDAECVCKCAGSSDWDNQVRGCLACAQSAGVPTTEAHQKCYEIADKKHGFLGSGLPARLDIVARCCKCIKGL